MKQKVKVFKISLQFKQLFINLTFSEVIMVTDHKKKIKSIKQNPLYFITIK